MTPRSAEEGSNVIRFYDGRGDGTPSAIIDSIHKAPVHLLAVSAFLPLSPLLLAGPG